jgi:hypothetical protein
MCRIKEELEGLMENGVAMETFTQYIVKFPESSNHSGHLLDEVKFEIIL